MPRRRPRPASQAPGAMPALTPVCTKPIASLSRERGTEASISENSAISVGARARPVRNRATRRPRARPGSSGSETVPTASRTMPDPGPLPAAGAARSARRRPRRRPGCRGRRRRASARRAPCARRRRRRRPWPPPARRTGCPAPTAPDGRAAPAAPTASGRGPSDGRAGAAGGCGAALQRPARPCRGCPTTTATTQPGLRRAGRGQERHQRRTGDEDDLVGDALDRERGVPLASSVEQVRPAGPDHRADLRDADARRATASTCGHGQRPVLEDRDDHQPGGQARRRTAST